MTSYTPSDFARASFARKGDRLAMRCNPNTEIGLQWLIRSAWYSDAEMAELGWTPVVEATPVEMTGKFVDLADRVTADASHSMTWIASVRETLHWLDEHPEAVPRLKTDDDPLTTLADWWDGAEVADQAEKGDVVMHKDDAGFSVWTERFHGFKLDDSYRILRRAPKPKSVKEQIEDMILELDREAGHLSDSEMIAAALTERFDITLKEDEK